MYLAVATLCDIFIVGNYYKGNFLFLIKPEEQILDIFTGLTIKVTGWLISEYYTWVIYKCSRYTNTLFLTSAKIGGFATGLFCQLNSLQCLYPAFISFSSPDTRYFKREYYVIKHSIVSI